MFDTWLTRGTMVFRVGRLTQVIDSLNFFTYLTNPVGLRKIL